jgi:hypothetical protein
MTGKIPERKLIGDPITGMVFRSEDAVLITTDASSLPSEVRYISSGQFVLRYGVRLLDKSHLSLVPGLLALDYGDMLVGEEAWDFLLKRSHLHPRADVVGYMNDGSDEMRPVKSLDLAVPLEVLVYADTDATTPLASVESLIAPANAPVAPRILEHLPRFDSLEKWRESRNE